MTTKTMQANLPFKNLIVPMVVMLVFVGLGLWGFLSSGYLQALLMFGYITVCPHDALKLSFGFDLGGLEKLRERAQTSN